MADSGTTFTREELYELVWSKPAVKIAREHGVSRISVVRASDRLGVPMPTLSHWIKIEHGVKVPRPELPERKKGQSASATLEAGKALRRRVYVAAVKPDAAPDAWETKDEVHSVAQQTRAAYLGGGKRYGTEILFAKDGFPHFVLEVSRSSLDRAVAILSRLAWALESKGFSLELDRERGIINPVRTATKTAVRGSLLEVVERHKLPDKVNAEGCVAYDRLRYVQTGRLRVVLTEWILKDGMRQSWGDGKHQKLEDKIHEIVEGCAACAEAKFAEHQIWEAKNRVREEAARLRAEMEALRAAEQVRRDLFQVKARQWDDARQMREFRAACEARLRAGRAERKLIPEEEAWLAWADKLIETLDPFCSEYLSGAIAKQPQALRAPGST